MLQVVIVHLVSKINIDAMAELCHKLSELKLLHALYVSQAMWCDGMNFFRRNKWANYL